LVSAYLWWVAAGLIGAGKGHVPEEGICASTGLESSARSRMSIDSPLTFMLSSATDLLTAAGRRGSGSVWCRSGEFISPNGGVKPPLHQIDPLPPPQVNCAFKAFRL